jgi:hypothetical protein
MPRCTAKPSQAAGDSDRAPAWRDSSLRPLRPNVTRLGASKKSNASQGKIEVPTNQTARIRRIFG